MKTFFGLTLSLLLSACSLQGQQDSPMRLIYVYDALCGWCYGFSPVIEAFAAQHQGEFQVEVLSGGMVTGQRIGPIGEVAPYIAWAYKEVEKASGVAFGAGFLEGILKPGQAIFTSIPPAKALSAFKRKQPDLALAFAARLQKAIYFEGIEPLDEKAYARLAEEFGLDAADFIEAMRSEAVGQAVQAEFAQTQALGVRGFPTIILLKSGKQLVLAQGFMPLSDLEKQYQAALKNN